MYGASYKTLFCYCCWWVSYCSTILFHKIKLAYLLKSVYYLGRVYFWSFYFILLIHLNILANTALYWLLYFHNVLKSESISFVLLFFSSLKLFWLFQSHLKFRIYLKSTIRTVGKLIGLTLNLWANFVRIYIATILQFLI